MAKNFLVLSLALLVAGCAGVKTADNLTLEKKQFSELSGWRNGNHSAALTAFLKSCEHMAKLPDGFRYTAAGGPMKAWRLPCNKAQTVDRKNPASARAFFEREFVPFQAGNSGNEEGLFTGYYELELKGSKKKKSGFTQALYSTPPGITKPFLGRRRIDNGEISGKGLELVYVNDPVRAFFLQIQGSGRVHLDDGSVMRVGYAEQNGCPYQPIGKYLVEIGALEKEEVTAQAIKNWLYNNPHRQREVMHYNPSYVFFRELKDDGPIGGQGVALTPEASLAVDKSWIGYGTPMWLETTLPNDNSAYNQLFIAQDTGGAIKGPVRGDVFFGAGKRAEDLAGKMKQKGSYYLLLPRGLSASAEKLYAGR